MIFDQLVEAGVSPKTEAAFDALERGDYGAANRVFIAASMDKDGAPPNTESEAGFKSDIAAQLYGKGTPGWYLYGIDYPTQQSLETLRRDEDLVQTMARIDVMKGVAQGVAIANAIKDIHGDIAPYSASIPGGGEIQGALPPEVNQVDFLQGVAALSPEIAAGIDAYAASTTTEAMKVPDQSAMGATWSKIIGESVSYQANMLKENYVLRGNGREWFVFNPYSGLAIPDEDGNPITFSTEEILTASKQPSPEPPILPAFGEGTE